MCSTAPAADALRAQVKARMLEVAIHALHPLPVSVNEEIDHARVLHQPAFKVVSDVMHDGRLGKAVQIEKLAALVDDITQSVARNSGALLSMLRLQNKDDYTFMLCVSVGTLMVAFGRSLGMRGESLRQAGIGGFVHDVGIHPTATLVAPE